MKRFYLLAAVAVAAQAIASTSASAQSPRGQQPAIRDYRAEAEARTRSRPARYSVQSYLNGGDYASGAAVIRSNAATETEISRSSDDTTMGPASSRAPGEILHSFDPTRSWDDFTRDFEFEAQNAHDFNPGNLDPLPPGAPGTRQVSNYERAQTQLLRDDLAVMTQQRDLAAVLASEAAGYELPDVASQARELRETLNFRIDILEGALQQAREFEGREFRDELSARAYVNLRNTLTRNIGVDGSQRTEALQNIVNAVAPVSNRTQTRADGSNHEIEVMQGRLDVMGRQEAGVIRRTTTGFALETYDGIDPAHAAMAASARYGDRSILSERYAEVERTRANAASAAASGAAGGTAGSRSTGSAGRAAGAEIADAAAAMGQETATSSSERDSTHSRPVERAEDNAPPRPVPTSPDYPTHVRTQAERDAYDRRRQAEQMAAEAARQDTLRREREAESARQAELARREAARLANERARIAAAAQALAARDARWNAMVQERFNNAVWDAFDANGGTLTTLQLEDIYRGYNPLNSIPPAQSLSSAPRSLSAAGRSLSLAGTPVRSGTDDYEDPAVQSLYEALYGLTGRRRGPLGPSEAEIETANFGDYDIYSDPTGRWGRESGGYLAANLFDQEVDYLSRSIVNGRGGLSALLAQPFNVILTWGAGAYDLDLHMTGPTGLGETDRFHIYYSATGSLTSFPFAALIKDCICSAGSEVILTTNLLGGGVYRVSVFNFGDQSANSNNLSNLSNATIQIVRGGVATAQGNGTTITGGRTILTVNVPNGQVGNTWIAAELDPRSGRITVPRTIVQSQDSSHVR